MPKLVTIHDNETGEKLIRNAVDAREIIATGKGRYSGKVAPMQEEPPEGPPVIEAPAADGEQAEPKPKAPKKPKAHAATE